MGAYEDFTLMFDDPTPDFSLDTFDSFVSFDPQNSNTKPDNFRQCVQNFSSQGSPGRPHTQDWSSLDASTFSSRTQSFESVNNVSDLLIPHSSQTTSSDHEGLRRCDLSHEQSDGSLTSRARMASAGQVDAHGIQVAANATNATNASSNSGELGVFTHSTQPSHVPWPSGSSQLDSDNRGGSPGEGAPHTYHDGQADIPVLIGGGQALADTALRQAPRPASSVLRSAVGTSPQSNLRRHRTRSDGVYDPALQSELSSISATNSSSSSQMEHAATLEGRPTRLGGTPVSPLLSSRGSVNSSQAEPTLSSFALSPQPSSSPGASAPLSSAPLQIPQLATTSPIASTPARASSSALLQQPRAQSALFARPSPFDRVDGTHARATEMFRLKHRIPASLDTSTRATGFVPSVADLSAQANGGAYPRLRSTTTASTSSTATTVATHQQTTANQTSPSTSVATRQQRTEYQSVSSITDKTQATEANGARMLFTESDTRRYRDHHGRASLEGTAPAATPSVAHVVACIAIAILALGVVLTSTSTTAFANPSLVLLAIFAPAFVASNKNTANSPNLQSRIFRALTSKRPASQAKKSASFSCANAGKQQGSLATFSLHRPLGCV